MWPVAVLVLEVLYEDCFEVTSTEDEQSVEAFPADGTDEALSDGLRPWCTDRVLINRTPSLRRRRRRRT